MRSDCRVSATYPYYDAGFPRQPNSSDDGVVRQATRCHHESEWGVTVAERNQFLGLESTCKALSASSPTDPFQSKQTWKLYSDALTVQNNYMWEHIYLFMPKFRTENSVHAKTKCGLSNRLLAPTPTPGKRQPEKAHITD